MSRAVRYGELKLFANIRPSIKGKATSVTLGFAIPDHVIISRPGATAQCKTAQPQALTVRFEGAGYRQPSTGAGRRDEITRPFAFQRRLRARVRRIATIFRITPLYVWLCLAQCPMTYGCGGPQNGLLASNWSHAPTSTLFNCNAGVAVQGLASPARGFLMMVVAMSAGCGACHRHATRRRALARAPRFNASLTASLTASRAWRASGVLG